MDYLDKIKVVRESIKDWQKENGNEFSYVITGFYEGDDPIYDAKTTITKEEHKEIVKYLERRQFIKIISESNSSAKIKILPRENPIIKLQTLELISKELKNYYTGEEIIRLLGECGVENRFIKYPTSKWIIFYSLFEELANGKDDRAKNLLLKIISEAVHPLNLGGNVETSQKLVDEFNEYLKYDNLIISYIESSIKFEIIEKNKSTEKSQTEEEKIKNQIDFEEIEREEISLFQTPKKLEGISLLRKNYQTLMNLVETFCENPSKPTTELNNAYIKLRSNIYNLISSIGLLNKERFMFNFIELNQNSYNIPFSNLFSAEKEFNEHKRKLSWDSIRPEMNAMYGEIETIYQTVNASDILSEPDAQNQINDIMLLLSKTKEENNKIIQKEENSKKENSIQKIEIIGIPDLNIKNTENNIIQKGKKKIHLPKFKTTDWSKIEIRFLSERDVLITTDKKEVTPANYEILGFSDDKKNKPNTAWAFLLGLSKNNGETSKLPKPIPDTIRQQKLSITQKLKAVFNNETDPFYDSTETQTYKIKIKLIPPQVEDEKEDQYGTGEYLKDTMTEEYE